MIEFRAGDIVAQLSRIFNVHFVVFIFEEHISIGTYKPPFVFRIMINQQLPIVQCDDENINVLSRLAYLNSTSLDLTYLPIDVCGTDKLHVYLLRSWLNKDGTSLTSYIYKTKRKLP